MEIDMDVVWLGQPDCHNSALSGGKAANLSRFAASYPVPPGFCLTTAVFDRWAFKQNEAGLPPLVQRILAGACNTLAEQCGTAAPGVAVRSSAVDEDGQTASFAGQYDTFLNIVGDEAISDAVARCWASARSPRVEAYRHRQGLPTHNVRLAVLVQQLVAADISAVAFSVNPVTGNSGEIIINASWGLGESIVSGTVTPDTYMVRKSDLSMIKRQIARKRRMTVLAPNGTREVAVPGVLSDQPVINNTQTIEIARLVLALESETGWPADIECAFKGETLYLLQCRPITTIA